MHSQPNFNFQIQNNLWILPLDNRGNHDEILPLDNRGNHDEISNVKTYQITTIIVKENQTVDTAIIMKVVF